MKLGLFSVLDKKAAAFLPPFCLPTDGMAVRIFTDCVNDPEHAFSRHPEDYSLYRVADFDDEFGTFLVDAAEPVLVVSALSVKLKCEEA